MRWQQRRANEHRHLLQLHRGYRGKLIERRHLAPLQHVIRAFALMLTAVFGRSINVFGLCGLLLQLINGGAEKAQCEVSELCSTKEE